MILNGNAQDLAFKVKKKMESKDKKGDADKIPLIEILDRIELHHNVSFAYQKKFLSGKLAVFPPLLTDDFEPYLVEILALNQLGLKRVENIQERIYIISPLEDTVDTTRPLDHRDLIEKPVAGEEIKKYRISGTVKGSADETPLPGVNVLLKGTREGTTTDMHGNFSLEVPYEKANILVFSYIGFSTEERSLYKMNNIDVVLTEDIQSLTEVVVTALGISRRQKSLGYAVNTVDSDDLTSSGSLNVASALYGKSSGIRIRSAPGGATSAVTVQVRGLNSLNYNAQPLYVIDGVIMRDGNEKGAAGINNDDYFVDPRIRGNGILDLNPSDIETLTILKGASASALYGSDAASGVILITTKKGSKKPGLGVDINYQLTQEEVAFTPRYQNVYGPGFDRKRNLATGADEYGWVSVDRDGDGTVDGQRPLFESYAQFGPKMDGRPAIWWDGSTRNYSPQPDNYKNF